MDKEYKEIEEKTQTVKRVLKKIHNAHLEPLTLQYPWLYIIFIYFETHHCLDYFIKESSEQGFLNVKRLSTINFPYEIFYGEKNCGLLAFYRTQHGREFWYLKTQKKIFRAQDACLWMYNEDIKDYLKKKNKIRNGKY